MPEAFDVVIAGAGLAGASAALSLAATRRVLVLEADRPASAASGMAAGTANPLMSLWARPVWRMEEALEALRDVLSLSGSEDLARCDGLLRPAADERQATAFARAASEHPGHAAWLTTNETADRFPAVRAPHGALWNETALTVHMPSLVDRMLRTAVARGAVVRSKTTVMHWTERSECVRVSTQATGRSGSDRDEASIEAQVLILCIGRHYVDFPVLNSLRLHLVKGQLIDVARPPGLGELPNVAGRGYVVSSGETLILGSTYEHRFCDLEPSPHQTAQILSTVSEMVPAIAGARVLAARAGVRVTVPGIRLPMVGPLPGHRRTWTFTGLGSKGLLMAPLVARSLPEFLRDPTSIPRDIRVRPARPASP